MSLRLVAIVPLVLLSSCAWMLSAPTPMPSLEYSRSAEKPRRCLLVMLPGRGDRAADYAAHGFLEALQKRPLAVDAVVPDAVVGYYARRNLIERLRDDVVEPARRKGYEQVWVLGISMGGLGSLLYAKAQPEVNGVMLLAPFLGDADVLEEIGKAGGPRSWTPRRASDDDYQRDLWAYLQQVLASDQPRLSLGFGEQDRMADGHRLLAGALPADRVYRTTGGHDWDAWSRLWNAMLDRSEFATACAEPASHPENP